MTLSEVAAAIGTPGSDQLDGLAIGVSTDTRESVAGSVFFALRGENSDGHAYVRQALSGGAVAAVVERIVDGDIGLQLVVGDTLHALGDLAEYYRSKFELPVIGVTGSVGKTSTKEMIATVLASRLNVRGSLKNYNNEIGVPKTLFDLDCSHQAAVIELGMRGPGQIARLAKISKPTIGVVTNVGVSHLEFFGSRDEIAAAKAELLDALPHDGHGIVNADDDYVTYLISHCRCSTLTFGRSPLADFCAHDIEFDQVGRPHFKVNECPFELNVTGVHHVSNAAAACAVGFVLGIPLQDAAEQLRSFRAPAMRMEVLEIDRGITILNDAYNAAPDSIDAALETLARMAGDGRRSVAILGDMRELGTESRDYHRLVGSRVVDQQIALLITVGAGAEEIARMATDSQSQFPQRTVSFGTTEEAANQIAGLLLPGDLVLIKGSRAMAMERIVEELKNHST